VEDRCRERVNLARGVHEDPEVAAGWEVGEPARFERGEIELCDEVEASAVDRRPRDVDGQIGAPAKTRGAYDVRPRGEVLEAEAAVCRGGEGGGEITDVPGVCSGLPAGVEHVGTVALASPLRPGVAGHTSVVVLYRFRINRAELLR
jgi:hypothetical protein